MKAVCLVSPESAGPFKETEVKKNRRDSQRRSNTPFKRSNELLHFASGFLFSDDDRLDESIARPKGVVRPAQPRLFKRLLRVPLRSHQ